MFHRSISHVEAKRPFKQVDLEVRVEEMIRRQRSARADGNANVASQQELPERSMASSIPRTLTQAPRKLLIASLGNPGSLYNTLHSTGHLVLDGLRSYLEYPPFQNSRIHASAAISCGEDAVLYKSPSYMNTSGPPLATAWRAFLRDLRDREVQDRARLIIIHDELELELGKVKSRKPGGSLRGHNGLKSVNGTAAGGPVSGGGGAKFWRIGIGIGRPVGRERGEVSDYVLRKITAMEREKIDESIEVVAEELARLRDE